MSSRQPVSELDRLIDQVTGPGRIPGPDRIEESE
jgi:hypothetical protein